MSQSQSRLAKCPKCNHEQIYSGQAKRPRITCSKCKHRYYILDQVGSKQKIIKKSQSSIPPTLGDTKFIDDPDELLMSVAKRELNKPNPDPRWATILIQCKKENIADKNEVIERLQQQPTKNLIEILKKQSGRSLQTE